MESAAERGAGPREYLACAAVGICAAAVLFFLTSTAAALSTLYLSVAMLLIMVTDARIFIIPDRLSLPAIPAGLIASLSVFPEPWGALLVDRILAATVASAFLYGVRHIHWRWRGIEGLGLGDVKLAAVAGAWLGLANLVPACLLATAAALTAVLFHALKEGAAVTGTTRVPFGSFIAPAILGMWIWQVLQLESH
jgi:leader peptidase (prepilin peptidase)/N-methyltransferase